MGKEHVAESPSTFGVETLLVKAAVVCPAEQQADGLYQLVHFIGMNRGQLAVILGKYGFYSPVNGDIDFLFRLLLGDEYELRTADFRYHVLAYP